MSDSYWIGENVIENNYESFYWSRVGADYGYSECIVRLFRRMMHKNNNQFEDS